MRRRSRSACRAHSENLAPKVVGSACIPCVRPVTGMSMHSTALAFSARTSWEHASMSRSEARVSVAHNAVSTTSEEVRP